MRSKTDRIFILVGIWMLSMLVRAQEDPQIKSRYYISKQNFEKNYSTKDSIGFTLKDGDTLIGVKNHHKPEGVPVPYEYKDSTFLELYKKVAFQPIHKDSSNTKPMKYWKDDIKIFFSEGMSKSVIKAVLKFTNVIDKEVDSLKIKRVKNLQDSNYVIYYNTDYEYSNDIKNNKASSYWVSWNRKSQIDRGYIRIIKPNMFSDKLAQQKIKELFVESLGWFVLNNELGCESYFSNCYSDDKNLSQLDLELIKYHYSYGICKGTRLKDFEEQHKHAKENLKTYGAKILFYHNE